MGDALPALIPPVDDSPAPGTAPIDDPPPPPTDDPPPSPLDDSPAPVLRDTLLSSLTLGLYIAGVYSVDPPKGALFIFNKNCNMLKFQPSISRNSVIPADIQLPSIREGKPKIRKSR